LKSKPFNLDPASIVLIKCVNAPIVVACNPNPKFTSQVYTVCCIIIWGCSSD